MKILVLALFAITVLTLSAESFAYPRSFPGSPLGHKQNDSRNSAPQEQQQEIEDMRTVVGGSMGGTRGGTEDIQKEEAPLEGKSFQVGEEAVSCEEALEICQ